MANSWELSREIKEREAIARHWITKWEPDIHQQVAHVLKLHGVQANIEAHGVAWSRILTFNVNMCDTYKLSFVVDDAIPASGTDWQELANAIALYIKMFSEDTTLVTITMPSNREHDGGTARTVFEQLRLKLCGVPDWQIVNIEYLYWLGFSWGIGEPKYLAWLLWKWFSQRPGWDDNARYEWIWERLMNNAGVVQSEGSTKLRMNRKLKHAIGGLVVIDDPDIPF